MLCSELSLPARIYWMALFHQTSLGPITKASFDSKLGIHRGYRLRLLSELQEKHFVRIEEQEVILSYDKLASVMLSIPKEQDLLSSFAALVPLASTAKSSQKILTPTASKTKYKISKAATDVATNAWNRFTHESYQKERSMSPYVMEAIYYHTERLIGNTNTESIAEVVTAVCNGIKCGEWDWWINTIDDVHKNAKSVFGSGPPKEKKVLNVDKLYSIGSKAKEKTPTHTEYRLGRILLLIDRNNKENSCIVAHTQEELCAVKQLLEIQLEAQTQIRLAYERYSLSRKARSESDYQKARDEFQLKVKSAYDNALMLSIVPEDFMILDPNSEAIHAWPSDKKTSHKMNSLFLDISPLTLNYRLHNPSSLNG